jgi:hypothetical protein
MTCFVVGCGRMLCDWFVGSGVLIQKVLWYVGGTGGHGKNEGITISITNAGAKRPTFKKWTLKYIFFGPYDFYGFLHRGGPSWQDGLFFSPSCQDGLRCQNAPSFCYTNVSWVIWYRLHM